MRALNLVLLSMIWFAAACGKVGTAVKLTLSANPPLSTVTQLHLKLVNDGVTREYDVTPPSQTIPPDITIAIEVPPSATGSLDVTVEAYAGAALLGDAHDQVALDPGAVVPLSLTLGGALTPDLRAPLDLEGADLSSTADLAIENDLAVEADLGIDAALPDDLTTSMMDSSTLNDSAAPLDLTVAKDFTAIDLANDLAPPSCPSSLAPALRDDFRSGSLDLTKWVVVGHNMAAHPASATIESGELKLVDRPQFNTVVAYPPTSSTPVRVTGEWRFGLVNQTDSDNMQIVTRSSGQPDPTFAETTEGIECRITSSGGSTMLQLLGKNVAATPTGGVDSVALVMQNNDVYLFEMFDDGTNVTCRVLNRRSGVVSTVSGATSFVSAVNKVTFSNREFSGGLDQSSFLDNVIVEHGVLSAPSHEWLFDEKTGTNALAMSGRNGTLGSATTHVAGLVGNAVALPGADANSFITLTNQVASFGTGDFSFSFWINVASLPSATVEMLNTREDATCKEMVATRLGPTGLAFEHYQGAAQCAASSATTTLATNTWVHLAFVRQLDSYAIYVDGTALAKPRTGLLGNADNTQPLIFGRTNSSASASRFVGLVDDIRVYGRALNVCEVGAIASTGR